MYVSSDGSAFTQTGASIIAANTADAGGGMCVNWGRATLNGGQIISNSASHGGGVYVSQSSAAFTQTGASIIAANTANFGGGVGVGSGNATLSGGQIISNSAEFSGGGVSVGRGNATLSGGQIISNSAELSGGGVYVHYGSATLSGGQIISNSADYGGGVYVALSSAAFTQTGVSIIAANTADAGGGMYVNWGRATLSGGEIVANNAITGSALFLASPNTDITTIAPSILSGDVYQSDGSFYGSDHDLRIDGALTVISGTFHAPVSFDLTGVFSHTGGTYYQTRPVNGGGDVGFPKAGGVILDANGQDLGSTQVAITAGELCAGMSAGDAVAHCYVITPTNATGRDATVTFYYNDDELPSGHACSAMQAHRWDGSWDHVLTRDAAYGNDGRMCGGDPQSIRVTNVMTFSPFALRGPQFNLTAQPDHLIANGVDASVLTASAPPFFAGRVVTFTWNMGYIPSPVTDTINASGVASYTYVAGNTPGADVVTASVYDEGATKTATATIQLDSSPLLGNLSSVFRGEVITYTFIITNVGTVADTNVVMTGSIPANTELVWVSNGIWVPSGGDYGWGYVSTLTYPRMEPGEVYVIAWSVRTLLRTGDILTQAHARSDQNVLRLPLQDHIYRILLPYIWCNVEP